VISGPLQGYWELPSRTALTLKAGELSPVIESSQGVYLVKAGNVTPADNTRFEEAQASISHQLREAHLRRLRSDFLLKIANGSALGDMEPFVQAVVLAAPESTSP